ncbi:Holliday junction branch migration protein RuvA [Fodinicola feengrottensis]|nr:Holliday junction branch migration protein RuvA [Fodinicola feengrottensis]
MITSVSGTVARIGVDHAVVEVGGVGLAVLCTPHALANLRTGSPGRLATSLIVREDSLTLYGFADDEERDLFELLQTANGVGPKVARAILAVLSPDEIRRAVSTGDHKTLTRAPGLGPKGAEKNSSSSCATGSARSPRVPRTAFRWRAGRVRPPGVRRSAPASGASASPARTWTAPWTR